MQHKDDTSICYGQTAAPIPRANDFVGQTWACPFVKTILPLLHQATYIMANASAACRALRVITRTGVTVGRQATRQTIAQSPLSQLRSSTQRLNTRQFSLSPALLKKGGKSKGAQATSDGSAASPAKDDPYDFSGLDKGIAEAHEKLKEELRKLRPGGRLNTQVLENLKVRLDKESNELTSLGDLAQFVPRGRTVNIMVGEEAVSLAFSFCGKKGVNHVT